MRVNMWGQPVEDPGLYDEVTTLPGGGTIRRTRNDRPAYPGFDRILNGSGRLNGNLEVRPKIDSRAYNAYQNQALSAGPSPWASMAMQARDMETAQGVQRAQAGAAGQAAAARTNLAMRGGLRGGALERIAGDQSRNAMNAAQDVRRQGELSKLEIMSKDGQAKTDMLSNAAGMANDRARMEMGADQFNITNALGEKRAEDLAKINKYNEEMRAWAAGKQAQATENSGKK